MRHFARWQMDIDTPVLGFRNGRLPKKQAEPRLIVTTPHLAFLTRSKGEKNTYLTPWVKETKSQTPPNKKWRWLPTQPKRNRQNWNLTIQNRNWAMRQIEIQIRRAKQYTIQCHVTRIRPLCYNITTITVSNNTAEPLKLLIWWKGWNGVDGPECSREDLSRWMKQQDTGSAAQPHVTQTKTQELQVSNQLSINIKLVVLKINNYFSVSASQKEDLQFFFPFVHIKHQETVWLVCRRWLPSSNCSITELASSCVIFVVTWRADVLWHWGRFLRTKRKHALPKLICAFFNMWDVFWQAREKNGGDSTLHSWRLWGNLQVQTENAAAERRQFSLDTGITTRQTLGNANILSEKRTMCSSMML